MADADNIKGVEFDDKDQDENPHGVEAWTHETGLSELYPDLKDSIYAVSQSVSSMSDAKAPPHRRYRLVFLFDKPITTVEHYKHVLAQLAIKYPIISTGRSPAQPVFGNAREGYNKAHVAGRVLSLDDYPLPTHTVETTPEQRKLEKREWQTDEIDKTALQFVDPDLIYEDWFRVVSACKAAGMTAEEVEAWSQKGTKYKEGDIQKRWEGIRADNTSWRYRRVLCTARGIYHA